MEAKRFVTWKRRLLGALPFLMMYGFVIFLGTRVRFFVWAMVVPNILFTVLWILFFVLICENLGRIAGKIVYGMLLSLFLVLFFVNSVYFHLTKTFFGFHLLQMADEGGSYALETILHTSPWIFVYSACVIGVGLYSLVHLETKEKAHAARIAEILGVFLLVHGLIPLLYGRGSDELKWNSFQDARKIYSSFYDKNKAVQVCGFYEYAVRDFYITYLKPKPKDDPAELALLEQMYGERTVHASHAQTGKFAGKNVIFLQLEGIDTWILTEETMPNLYKLVGESMEFTNHFSYYNGGGSTFNSELAVNTGFITPVSYTQNAFTFVQNAFPYSLPNVLKKQGYHVSAFHMNTGEFYSRRVNYLNWGYDAYHGLLDEGNYKDASYKLDRELIENENFYKMLFAQQPFMDYVITYTPHKPFNKSNEAVQLLLEENNEKIGGVMTEEDYVRLLAKETDHMIALLMQGLEKKELLDNTIIVGFTDHYLYTLKDKSILERYKITENNLINRTPFFIWSSEGEHRQVNAANAQIDILPTVLNLMGISYIEEYYMGRDILAPDYQECVYFSDGSMYDGSAFTEGMADQQIQKNDLTLKYDYFAGNR